MIGCRKAIVLCCSNKINCFIYTGRGIVESLYTVIVGGNVADVENRGGGRAANLASAPEGEMPSPRASTRKGRLQKLAAQINDWEDDLSHPQSAM